ncbi:MAG TPA: nicotinate phosphoribosyltransferase [Saprospiraceae bacterium]|nr:nicotinate phosphoribosyltransferase [Saprospiraceae bacterium]HMQ82049.1 nicotinate phosphoribosyltransferase [Saprospiraceae bacterium]
MASHIQRLYPPALGLMTDLYQLTMAYGYWKTGIYKKNAVFHLFFRKAPFGQQQAIAAGLTLAVDFIQAYRFDVHDIQYLGGLRGADGCTLFDESFLNYLQRLEFQCDVDAVPEGSVVFPHQPLLRIKGPLIQCQLLETALLTLFNFSTLIATKASRMVQAANGDEVLEFGLRRAQGLDGGITATRAAYVGGCHATSNVMAGRLYGIPVKGTHAHSWVMCFDDELEAFEAYAQHLPNNCILLVDTYDTLEGVANAIMVGKKLQLKGQQLLGIRLDSGDLADLSRKARQMLDEAGLGNAQIVASNDLDEYEIAALKEQGSPIQVWGIGTRLATAYDQPALGGVYKLAAIENESGSWDYRVKHSDTPIKVSNPGILQVRRFTAENGQPLGDVLYDEENPPQVWQFEDGNTHKLINFGGEMNGEDSIRSDRNSDLLVPVFRAGKLVMELPPLSKIRQFCLEQQQWFSAETNYPFGLEKGLSQKKAELLKKTQIAPSDS